MVVATRYNGVDLRDKVEIEYDTQTSGGWCGGDVIAKDINGKEGIKYFAMTLFAYDLDRTELRGVVYIIKRSGPSTKPWGTSNMSLMGLDRLDEIWTD